MAELPPPDQEMLSVLMTLTRDFPRWAIWLPLRGGPWTAVRPAGSRPPSREMPMIWVKADTSTELADRMRRSEESFGGR